MLKWIFRDPPSTLVATLRQIVERQLPIPEVIHVANEDPQWEFGHWQKTFSEQDWTTVTLEEIVHPRGARGAGPRKKIMVSQGAKKRCVAENECNRRRSSPAARRVATSEPV